MIEIVSIDLSNYCSKECPFCYNHSHREGNVMWTPQEVIAFATDCIDSGGVKAISLGGGEPLEYDGVFDVIDALYPKAYVTLTTNGLPLLRPEIKQQLSEHRPDKVHVSIHHPDSEGEVSRVIRQMAEIETMGIKPGVNLLVAADRVDAAADVYRRLRRTLQPDQIIILPQRFSKTPAPRELLRVTGGQPFQGPACLLKCATAEPFVSVSWDKQAHRCSYAGGKAPLHALTFAGLIDALSRTTFTPCTMHNA